MGERKIDISNIVEAAREEDLTTSEAGVQIAAILENDMLPLIAGDDTVEENLNDLVEKFNSSPEDIDVLLTELDVFAKVNNVEIIQ